MDYLSRAIDPVLREWAQSSGRKPLILRGARQTGKTEAIRHLGSDFEVFVELNLERYADAALLRGSRSPEDLLTALRARHNVAAFPPRTLLFIDEIQESVEAIRWLRFFYEDHPDLAVVAAGSLLEVRLEERGFSFPVGRVTFRTLRPLGFFELLRASGREVLATTLETALADASVPKALDDQALDLLREYLQVGGMPEAASQWVRTGEPSVARQVHVDLLQALSEDLQKYRDVRDQEALRAAFESLPQHYGRRYKYASFAPGYKSRPMQAALEKMSGAHLVTEALPTSSLTVPFQARLRSARKLIPLDVGLALTSMGFDVRRLRESAIDTALGGRVAEMFVAQELLTNLDDAQDLYFWVSESSRSNAEVDFVIAQGDEALPIEVKASAAGSLKSLHQFLWRSGSRRGVRLHQGAVGVEDLSVKMPDGSLDYRLFSLPLYAAPALATGSNLRG